MVPKAERNTAVMAAPHTREDGPPPEANDSREGGAVAELAALRQRIKAGLSVIATDARPKEAPACRDCFQRGWIAAMRHLLKG